MRLGVRQYFLSSLHPDCLFLIYYQGLCLMTMYGTPTGPFILIITVNLSRHAYP